MNFIWQKNNFTWPVCTASAAIFLSSCTGSVQKTTVRGGLFGDAVPGDDDRSRSAPQIDSEAGKTWNSCKAWGQAPVFW